jgi:hypothetical protein
MSLDEDPLPYRFRFIFAKDEEVLKVSNIIVHFRSANPQADSPARYTTTRVSIQLASIPLPNELSV